MKSLSPTHHRSDIRTPNQTVRSLRRTQPPSATSNTIALQVTIIRTALDVCVSPSPPDRQPSPPRRPRRHQENPQRSRQLLAKQAITLRLRTKLDATKRIKVERQLNASPRNQDRSPPHGMAQTQQVRHVRNKIGCVRHDHLRAQQFVRRINNRRVRIKRHLHLPHHQLVSFHGRHNSSFEDKTTE